MLLSQSGCHGMLSSVTANLRLAGTAVYPVNPIAFHPIYGIFLPLGYAYARVCLSQIIPQGGLVSGMKSLSLAERTLVLATIHCVPPEFSISHAPLFFLFFFILVVQFIGLYNIAFLSLLKVLKATTTAHNQL